MVNLLVAVYFRLFAKDGEYIITRTIDERPLITQLRGYTSANAAEMVRNLEHIARWLKVLELQSSSSCGIPPDALKIQILEGEGNKENAKEVAESQIELEYQYNPATQKWEEPSFRIRLENQSQQVLFCACFDLTEEFEIDASVFPGGTLRLLPNETVWVNEGKPILGFVPKRLWNQGVTEYKDTLKVIVCTTDFDAMMMTQGALGQPLPPINRSPSRGSGSLNRLMQRVITRKFSNETEEAKTHDDWVASQVAFTIIRPQEAKNVSTDAVMLLCKGITLQPHPTFRAKVRLTKTSRINRALGSRMISSLPQTDTSVVQSFHLTASHGNDPGLNILELIDIDEATCQTVTPAHPLILTVAGKTLQPEERILAVSYNGKFFLPLGSGCNSDCQLKITLERLPEPVNEGEQSLQGSIICIFFQKVITKSATPLQMDEA
jgi:hypothetical protein